jgi:hypothetical protein
MHAYQSRETIGEVVAPLRGSEWHHEALWAIGDTVDPAEARGAAQIEPFHARRVCGFIHS